jgi:hypothetical protein
MNHRLNLIYLCFGPLPNQYIFMLQIIDYRGQEANRTLVNNYPYKFSSPT